MTTSAIAPSEGPAFKQPKKGGVTITYKSGRLGKPSSIRFSFSIDHEGNYSLSVGGDVGIEGFFYGAVAGVSVGSQYSTQGNFKQGTFDSHRDPTLIRMKLGPGFPGMGGLFLNGSVAIDVDGKITGKKVGMMLSTPASNVTFMDVTEQAQNLINDALRIIEDIRNIDYFDDTQFTRSHQGAAYVPNPVDFSLFENGAPDWSFESDLDSSKEPSETRDRAPDILDTNPTPSDGSDSNRDDVIELEPIIIAPTA